MEFALQLLAIGGNVAAAVLCLLGSRVELPDDLGLTIKGWSPYPGLLKAQSRWNYVAALCALTAGIAQALLLLRYPN